MEGFKRRAAYHFDLLFLQKFVMQGMKRPKKLNQIILAGKTLFPLGYKRIIKSS